MGAPVLVIISADPKTTHRANEALRIALGILAGENDVAIVLRGNAATVLGADPDDLVDGDDIAKHLATLKKLGQPFHVEASALRDGDWNEAGHRVIPVSPQEIADLMARTDRFLIFQ